MGNMQSVSWLRKKDKIKETNLGIGDTLDKKTI